MQRMVNGQCRQHWWSLGRAGIAQFSMQHLHPDRVLQLMATKGTNAMKKGLFLATVVVLVPCIAQADESPSCPDAYTRAQTLRNDHKLLDARAALRICVQPTCKDFIVKGCTTWLAQVEASMPSVVPVATDASGNDLPGVKVSMDGAPLLEKIDGRSVDVDPGTHTFAFEASDGTKGEKQVVVAEGEKGKRIAVTLGSPAPTPAAATAREPVTTSSGPPWKTIGLVTAGVGVVGLAVGSVFGAMAAGGCSNSVCATQADKNKAGTNADLSTGFFVAGGVLAASGVTMWLLAPKKSSMQVSPSAMNGGAGFVVKGVW